jgi:methionine sulfoxide reductase heme-binding subunit
MHSVSAYIISIIIALIILFASVIISISIKFEGGTKPKDPRNRRMWFWILALVTPVIIFLMGFFVFLPTYANRKVINDYISALSIGTVAGFFLYVILGFMLSRVFRNGKLGHWF